MSINKCVATAYQIDSLIDLSLRKKVKKKLGFEVMDSVADSILENAPDFIKTLMDKNDPESLEQYAAYLQGVASIMIQKVAVLAGTHFSAKTTVAYSALGVPMDTIAEDLNKIISEKIKPATVVSETTSDTNLTDVAATEDLNTKISNNEQARNIDVVRDLGILSFPELKNINKAQATYTEVVNHYFSNNPQLIEEMEVLLKNTFMNSIFDTNLNSEVPYRNVTDAVENTLHILNDLAQNSPLELKEDIANYANDSVEVRNGYYAKLLMNHFNNIVAELLPGIDTEKMSFDLDNQGKIVFTTDMSKQGTYDQMNRFIKQLLLDTTKLTSTQSGYETILSVSNRKMTESNINFSLNTTHDLDDTSFTNWCNNFEESINRLKPSEEKDILSSLYFKFFATRPYTLDGVEKQSLNYMSMTPGNRISEQDRQNIKHIVGSVYSHLKGNINAESSVLINNKVTLTQHLHVEAASRLIEDIKGSLVMYSTDGTTQTLKSGVLNRVSFEQTSDDLLLKINKHVIRVSTKENNGALFLKVETPLKDSENRSLIRFLLGSNSLLSNTAVIREYIINNKDTDYELTNLVANIAWVLKSKQDPSGTQELINTIGSKALKKVNFNNSNPELKNVLFNALDQGFNLESFRLTPLLIEASKKMSMETKTNRMNLARDIVSNIKKSSMMLSDKAAIREIDTEIAKGNKPVLARNLFASKKYRVKQFYTIEGIKVGENSKTLSGLSAKEQQHLYITSFASSAISSNYKEALLNLTTPSDKSNVEASLIEALNNNMEFLPVTNKNGYSVLNQEALVNQVIETKRNFYEDQAEQIISLWKSKLGGYFATNEVAMTVVNDIKNINQLHAFALAYKVPTSVFNELTSELHYKVAKDKSGSYATIGDVFLYHYNIWTNTADAKKKIEELKGEFFNALVEDGYYKKKQVTIDLPFDVNKALSARFSKNPTSSLLLSYFYAGLNFTSELNNLVGASIYQFKDGEGDSSTIINNTTNLIVEKEREKAAKTPGKEFNEVEEYEKAFKKVRMSKLYSNMYTNQIKRNAPLTSGIEKLKLVSKSEKGLYMEKKAYTAVVEDNNVNVELLGALSDDLKQESTDAVCFVLPFYHLKMSNSSGGPYSTNFELDAPLKDITLSKDPLTNVLTIQKKASFKLSVQKLKNGSPLLQKTFVKMMDTVKYNTPITINDKVCNSLYDVWNANGGWSSMSEAFALTASFLAENTEYRNQYIEMLAFKSAEKTGNSHINKFESLGDLSAPLLYKEINMMNHGNILRAGHDTDTTSVHHKSELSLTTQLITALGFEGSTQDISNEVYSALQHISNSELNLFNENIRIKSLESLQNTIETLEDVNSVDAEKMADIMDLVSKARLYIELTASEEERLQSYLTKFDSESKAIDNVFKDITKKAIATRQSHGPATDLINKERPDWGSLQLRTVMRTALASHLNDLAIRVKMPGGQHVVATAEKFLQVFTTKSGARLTRASYNKTAPKLTVIDESNAGLYSYTDLVTVDNDPKEISFGEAITLEGEHVLRGVDLTTASELNFMKYFKYTEDGTRIYFGTKETGTEDLYNALKNSKDANERRQLENEIQFELNDDGWVAESTEFITPMMHATAFNINVESDDIVDILGDVDVYKPDAKPRMIENSRLFFVKRLKSISKNSIALRDLVKDGNKQGLLLDFFSVRKNGELRLNLVKANGAISIDKTVRNLKKKMKGIESTEVKDLLNDIIKSLKDNETNIIASKGDLNDEFLYTNTLLNLGTNAKQKQSIVIEKLAKSQADSFYRTLTFVTGRIPSQGKQSGTVGRSVGFINDTKNTFYTGVTFTKLTGQDHDNDKLNTMVLAVDDFGNVYDYAKYLGTDGKISSAKQEEERKRIINEINELYKDESLSERSERLKSALDAEHNYLINALKNYTFNGMMRTFNSSKNAIESQTPISMDSLQNSVKKVGGIYEASSEDVDDDDRSPSNFSSKNFNPDNIATLPSVNRTMTVGKGVVGIGANSMKIYGAVFNANSQDPEKKFTKFRINEKMENLPFISSKDFMDIYKTRFGLETNYDNQNTSDVCKIFFKDPNGNVSVIKSNGVANINSIVFESSKNEAIKNIGSYVREKYANLDPESKEYAKALHLEIQKYIDDNSASTLQAWEYISEILSAATDNAKEFILGRIGADTNTSGIIANMLILGFDLSTAINLITEPVVQEIFRKSEITSELNYEGRRRGIKELILEHLNYNVNNYTFNNKISSNNRKLSENKEKLDSLLENKLSSVELINKGIKSTSELVKNDLNKVKDTPVSSSEYTNIRNGLKTHTFYKTNWDVSDNHVLRNLINTIKQNDTTFIFGTQKENDYMSLALATAKFHKKTVYFLDHKGEIIESINGANLPIVIGNNYTIINNDGVDFDPSVNNDLLFTETNGINNYDAELEKSIASHTKAYNDSKDFKQLVMDEVLLDGPRQLLQFIIALEESRAIGAMLNSNQGIKITDWEESVFLSKCANALIPGKEFNKLPSAINDILEGNNLLTDEYSFYNASFVMHKNPHFLGYIKAQLTNYNLNNKANNVQEIISKIANDFSELEEDDNDPSVSLMNEFKAEKSYKSIAEIPYNYAIYKMYNNSELPDSFKNLEFNLLDASYKFNLSNAEERAAFLSNFPQIIDGLVDLHPALKSNLFLNSLRKDSIVDIFTNNSMPVLKTGNLLDYPTSELAKLKLSFDALNNSDNSEIKSLYNALIHYSLIMTKGGNDKSSYALLINPLTDIMNEWHNTLNGLTTKEVMANFNSLRKVLGLLAPESIQTVSTAPKESRNSDEIEVIEQGKQELAEQGIFIRENGNRKNKFLNVPVKYKDTPDLLRSKEYSDLVFHYGKNHLGKDQFMIVTPKANLKSVIIDFKPNNFGALSRVGWQYGHTAKLDQFRTGQVVYPIDSSTYACLVNDQWTEVTKKDLKSFNPDMVFDGLRIGKKSAVDNEIEESEEYKLAGLTKDIDVYIQDGVNYRITTEIPDGIKPGDYIKKGQMVRKGQQNIPVNIQYVGLFSSKDVIDSYGSSLYFKDKGLIAKNKKNDNDQPYHVIQVKLMERPKLVKNSNKLNVYSEGPEANAVIEKGATYFMSKKELVGLNINQDIISLGTGKSLRNFRVSKINGNTYTLPEFVKNSGSVASASKKLGITPYELETKLKDSVTAKNVFIYALKPYDSRSNFTNSRQEMNMIGKVEAPALDGVKIFQLKSLPVVKEIVNSLGAEIQEFSDIVANKKDIDAIRNSLVDKNGPGINADLVDANIDVITALAEATTTILYSNIRNNTSGLRGNTYSLNNYLAERDITIEEAESKKASIMKALKISETNFDVALLSLKNHLEENEKRDVTKRFSSYSDNFELQAAIQARKPLFVFVKNRDQWQEYDYKTNMFNDCTLPLFVGNNILVLGQERQLNNKTSLEALNTLFTHNNKFRELSDGLLGNYNVHGELAFNGVPVDAEINSSTETFSANTNTEEEFSAIADDSMLMFNIKSPFVSTILEDGEYKKVLTFEGEEFELTENNFKNQKNAVFTRYKDGAIKVTLTTAYGEVDYVSMPEDLRKEYSDFTGNKVYDTFKFSVDGKFFILKNVHKVNNILSFELRNQLKEEKAEVKKLSLEVSAMYKDVITPLYKAIRFPKTFDPKQSARFKGIDSYNDFITWISSDIEFDFSAKEKDLVNELLAKNKIYKEKADAVRKLVEEYRDEYSSTLNSVGSSDQFTDKNSQVLVLITDGFDFTKNKSVDKIQKNNGVTLSLSNDFRDALSYDKNSSVFYLKLFTDDEIAGVKALSNSVSKLIDTAEEIKDKQFILDLPIDNLGEKVFGDFTGYDAGRAMARALTLIRKNKKWPTNLVLSNKLSEFINTTDGFSDLSFINKIKDFEVVRSYDESNNIYEFRADSFMQRPMVYGSKDTILDTWASWLGTDNKSLFAASEDRSIVHTLYNNNEARAFKALISRWALLNPKQFNTLAASIGSKSIMDMGSKGNKFTVASTLAKVLNDKFVDNKWIDLPTTNVDYEITDEQSLVALPLETMLKDNKALVTSGGKKYLVELVYEKHAANPTNEALINDLGIDYAGNNYELPEYLTKPFNIFRITQIVESKDKYEFAPMQLLNLIEKANKVDLSEEHTKLFTDATHIIPIDILSNITEPSDKRIVSNSYITGILNSIDDNIFLDYNSNSVVALIGTKLTDRVYSTNAVQEAFDKHKFIIDKAMSAGATFNIGTETGIEEQAVSYILSKGTYSRKGDKLVKEPVIRTKSSTRIVVNTDLSINNFNSNNDINRGQTFSGILEATLDISKKTDKNKTFEIEIEDNEIQDLNTRLKSFASIITSNATIGNTENADEVNINKFVDNLISEEELFLESVLKLHLLEKYKDQHKVFEQPISSVSDLDEKFASLRLQDEFEQERKKLFSFFNRGRLTIAVRNRNITMNYIKSHFPKLVENTNQLYLDLIKKDKLQFITSEEYKAFLKSYNLSNSQFDDIIKDATTIEDAFFLLSTIGDNIKLNKGIPEGQIAAQILRKNLPGVKALSNNDRLLILDYSVVYGNVGQNQEDFTRNTKEITPSNNEAEIKLASANNFSHVYKYIKEYGFLTTDLFDNKKLSVNYGKYKLDVDLNDGNSKESTIEAAVQSIKSLLYSEAKSLYNKNITKIGFIKSESKGDKVDDFHVKKDFLAKRHISNSRNLWTNPWITEFKNTRSTTEIELDNGSFSLANYMGKHVNNLFTVTTSTKLNQIRFTPILVDEIGTFFAVHKAGESNAYIVEYTGTPNTPIKIEDMLDDNSKVFNKVGRMNVTASLETQVPINRAATYTSKEGNVFGFLYTGNNESDVVDGPFTIEKDGDTTYAVKYSSTDRDKVIDKYEIVKKSANLIAGAKHIWTPVNYDLDTRIETDSSNKENLEKSKPTNKEIEEQRKKCNEE